METGPVMVPGRLTYGAGGPMNEKYTWMVVAVLTALTLGQACYIYSQKASAAVTDERQPPSMAEAYHAKAYDSQWEELQKWRKMVRKQLDQGAPLLDPDFDGFFNDGFFSGRYEPFAELDRIHKRMTEEFGEPERRLFDDYWVKWYGRRMRLGQFRAETARTDREVILTIHVPGLSAKTADVDISNERIKIFFEARTASGEKGEGGLLTRESLQSYLKLLPLPEDAVPGTGRVEIEGEKVKITFALKPVR